MKTKVVRMTFPLCIVVGACFLWLCAAPSVCEVPESGEAVQKANAPQFTPLTQSHVARAKAEVCRMARILEGRLDKDGPNGRAWRKYVKLDELWAQLNRRDTPDLEKLDSVYTRLSYDYRGLELVWFVDVKSALKRYLNIARAIGNPEVEATYKEVVAKALPEELKAFAADDSPERAREIGRILGWLSDFHQAEELVSLTRKKYARRNVFIEVSDDFISAGMAGPIDETTQICDEILGTTIQGTGKTKGRVTVEMVPSDDNAVIETKLSGTTNSDNTGHHGPVWIHNTGVTTFEASKQLIITPEGIETSPATSEAETSTTINSICSRRGSRFVERAAWRRACKQKCLAEAIASQHAECRVNRRMDSQAGEMVAEANERFEKRFRRPLRERKIFPEELVVSTIKEKLRVRSLRAAYDQLAAPDDPPEVAAPADIALRVHQSMINNSAATLLAGRVVHEEEFLKTVEDILGEVPESLQPEEGKATWSIHFAPREAFTVTFGDGGFAVSLRAVGYTRDGKDYPGMNVSAAYKIEQSDKGFVAVRQGELSVFPPGFVKGERQLSAREQTLREMLEKRFAKVFSEKIVPQGYLEPKDRWEKVGRVPLAEWSARDGWMTLAWKMAKP